MAEQEPYSPDNPLHVAARKRREEREQREERDALLWVMSDRRGRLAIRKIIYASELQNSPFSSYRSQTDFNCGRQAEARKLIAVLEEHCPEQYLLLEQERLQGKIDAKIKDEAARTKSREQKKEEE